MKQILAITLVLSIAATGIAQESLSSFNKVSVTGSVILTLKKGDKTQYTTSGQTDNLKVRVEDGKLRVSRVDIKDISGRAYVTVWYTDIRSLSASAGAEIQHEGTLDAGDFELTTDTGAHGSITIKAESIDVTVGEGGVLRLDGTTHVLEATVTTGSTLKAHDLVAQHVYVTANTGGSASVNATDEIDANASLGGSINYTGSPGTVKVKESLGGSVND